MQARCFSARARGLLAGASTVAVLTGSAYTTVALAEAPEASSSASISKRSEPKVLPDLSKSTFVWGSNKHGIVDPDDKSAEQCKRPRSLGLLEGMVLRDLALHEQYAVAVDARGDLLQWGADMPSLQKKLTGRNIIKVALTPAKIMALSSSGKVYVLSSTSQPSPQSTTSWLLSYLWNSPQGVDHVELKPNSSLGWREKVQDIQAGQSHILALTSSGRCFSSPLDLKANDAGQLGVRQVDVHKLGQTTLYPAGFAPNDAFTSGSRRSQSSMEIAQAKALPRSWLPDHLKNQIDASEEAERTAEIAEVAARVARDQHADTERDIRFCSQLYEIPALKDLNIAQIACGERHNLVRTHKGRVLAFGSNSCGQLGIGQQLTFPVIPAVTEVAFGKNVPQDGSLICTNIAAGGDSSYFATKRVEPNRPRISELYGCGNGQYGGLGNGLWIHQASPVKIKALSGLLEWDEKRNTMACIDIHALSAGKGHAAVTLTNHSMDQSAAYGRDVYIWGANVDWQLGNGKRSNSPLPLTLGALPRSEAVINAKRMQLSPPKKVNGYKAEETICCGANTTAVYYKKL